ncbi:MAG: non-canonical purine NTP pyrophosphatase [Pseudomonadota bacterium]
MLRLDGGKTAQVQSHPAREASRFDSLTLITSNPNKVAEVRRYLGDDAPVTSMAQPIVEAQEDSKMMELRLGGNYSEVAKNSAIKKFESLISLPNLTLKHGMTIMDSAWFAESQTGLPGIYAASYFIREDNGDGTYSPPLKNLINTCTLAKLHKKHRAYWTESVAIVDLSKPDKVTMHLEYEEMECFIPATPQGDGWGFDPVTCPDPVELARLRGDLTNAHTLSKISDRDFQLPLEASKLGLLVSFAQLAPNEREHFSPRARIFKRLFGK